jgi:hypothetical protein
VRSELTDTRQITQSVARNVSQDFVSINRSGQGERRQAQAVEACLPFLVGH